MEHTIRLPKWLGFSELCDFTLRAAAAPESSLLRFDVGKERFISPTALAVLVKTCRRRSRDFNDERIVYRGLKNHSYANNLGMSEWLRVKGNPYPQRAFGGSSYLPLSQIDRAELDDFAANEFCEFGDAIEVRCKNIAEIVSQRRSAIVEKIVADSFREIVRNSFEHAEVDALLICAQYWNQRQEVEVCISDRGIGIAASLDENKKLEIHDDREALYLSLMPGISSKAWRHKKKKRHHRSVWDNSGFGLFFAHQLFGKHGHFFAASGGSAVLLQNGNPARDFECDIEGTLISMKLRLSDADALEASVKSISDLAFSLKQRIGTKSVSFASVESFLKQREE